MPDHIKIKVQKPGMFTTLQDLGRKGHQDAGVPFGGAMDKESHKIANELLDNPHFVPTIEMTYLGATFKFEGEGQIAITGADMNAKLNNHPVAMYKTIDIQNGDVLAFEQAQLGCRTYLGVKGEWQAFKWLDSFSSVSNLTDFDGLPKPLKKDDELEVKVLSFIPHREFPLVSRPIYSSCYILRVITGPEFERFSMEQMQSFFQKVFTISPDSNRMGYRLEGELNNYKAEREEISSGIVEGTIQITKSGKPIILTADAQTTGGYPRIANVVRDDLSIVAQMKAGDEVKFMLVNLSEL